MGLLFYGDQPDPIEMDDRTLAHLKVVIATKLRRHESFTLTWEYGDGQEPGRSTVFLHPAIPLRFVFDEPVRPELDRQWMQELIEAANTVDGIQLVVER